MSKFPPDLLEERKREAYRVASEMYRYEPDWLTFFREVLGTDGVIRRLFSTREAMAAFEQSEEYRAIQTMLADLRERSEDRQRAKEPTRVITVRLPKSVHELLQEEAREMRISMNKLCITKLLRVLTHLETGGIDSLGMRGASEDLEEDESGRD